MKLLLVALVSGVLFALGLGLSGMTLPGRVLGFLELRDPALALTMAGATLVTVIGFPRVLRRARPRFADVFVVPTRRDIDASLIGGAALFGVGWGLVGLCPGPALTDLVTGDPQIGLFVATMIAGMVLHRMIFDRNRS